jgi:hypothetical protein
MRRLVFTLMSASLSFGACAADGAEASMHARSLASAAAGAVPAKQSDAPFRAQRDPMPELILHEELARRGPRGSCEASATDLCYDLREARLVYRPARRFMPAFDGLQAESVSLRHHRIVFKYSFR